MKNEFWRDKSLAEMSEEEWESLCDGCGKCCLHKLEDEDTGEVLFTRVACRLLDIANRRCTRYSERAQLIPDCMSLRAGFTQFHWLPSTCAYRLLHEGKELSAWHPLRGGDPRYVPSVRAFAISEAKAGDPFDHVIEWLN